MSERTPQEILATGVAWVTESELERLVAQLEQAQEKSEALTSLRSAWNAHMARCGPANGWTNEEFFAKLAEWRDAPSGTASALTPAPEYREALEGRLGLHEEGCPQW